MKRFHFFLICLLLLTVGSVQAQRGIPRMNRKAMLDSLSPEQKKAIKEKLKARYDSLPAERKAEIRKSLKAKLDSLTPEEKQALKEQYRKKADSLETGRPRRRLRKQ